MKWKSEHLEIKNIQGYTPEERPRACMLGISIDPLPPVAPAGVQPPPAPPAIPSPPPWPYGPECCPYEFGPLSPRPPWPPLGIPI